MDNIMNILSILLCSLLWIMLTNALTMSVPVWRFNKHPQALKQYLITADNHIDFQHAKECAAFSTAYVLRHFNIDADGNALYPHFPFKFPDGSISPLGIRLALKRYGFKTKYYKGNIQSLKSELEHGIPVIAFLYSTPASKVRHFVPVTGYDEEGFYLAESLEKLVNAPDGDGIFNRKVSYSDFKRMWDIKTIYMPLYSNTYITCAPRYDK